MSWSLGKPAAAVALARMGALVPHVICSTWDASVASEIPIAARLELYEVAMNICGRAPQLGADAKAPQTVTSPAT